MNNKKTVECKLVKLAKNFGFAAPVPDLDNPPAEKPRDYFIPGRFLKGAMPGDIIMVEGVATSKGSDEGKVIEVIKEKNTISGTIDVIDGMPVILPDVAKQNPIAIIKTMMNGAQIGDKVSAEIIKRGDNHRDHRVKVSQCFGSSDNAKNCTKSILYSNGINDQFPENVLEEATVYTDATISQQDMQDRKDLRDMKIFTIDGADTKDIDDAISIETLANSFRLGIHIADVSHYVTEGTALNDEAYQRATSVYTTGAVVPMLPKELSNGICSLNPNVERLCFSCIVDLDENGTVTNYSFAKAVMRSRVKGVYSEINDILGGTATEEVLSKYSEVREEITAMFKLYEKLAIKRAERGCMDIETGESKIKLDENGKAVDIIKVNRGVSEQIIEEFMLLANNCSAKMGRKKNIPFLYRVHELPDPERIANLHTALTALGLNAKFVETIPTQSELAKLLDESRGTPIERAVHINILRSMAKAKYQPLPKGHYGLALEDYSHFTSPIRRYPDLIVHRMLSEVLKGTAETVLTSKYSNFVAEAAAHCSEQEVKAMTSERDSTDCYKAEFMQDKVGLTMEGTVSSVTNFGIYVELGNTVEGLVHISRLSKGEMTVVNNISLVDTLAGKSYRIGDKIMVKIIGASVSAGNIDFEPA